MCCDSLVVKLVILTFKRQSAVSPISTLMGIGSPDPGSRVFVDKVPSSSLRCGSLVYVLNVMNANLLVGCMTTASVKEVLRQITG